MTQEEIIEGNKLIAEFMGCYKDKEESEQYTMDKMHIFYAKHNSNLCSTRMVALPEDMLYHISWDWLMSVVEKIESTDPLGGIVMIQQGMCRITSRMAGDNSIKANHDNYLLMGAKGKLLSTYQSVIKFIKWYNENK